MSNIGGIGMKSFMLASQKGVGAGRNIRPTAVAAGIALAGLAAALLGGPAFAQNAPAQTTQEPPFACSIKVPAGTRDSGVKTLAKISEAQARQAAAAAVPGTVLRAEIENENGCAVYGVKIKSADTKIHDIKVDAGTGTVVHQELVSKTGDEHEGENEVKNESEDNE
jgi:hypothetical protein